MDVRTDVEKTLEDALPTIQRVLLSKGIKITTLTATYSADGHIGSVAVRGKSEDALDHPAPQTENE